MDERKRQILLRRIADKEKIQAERNIRIKELWNNLKPFQVPDDVPNQIPIVTKDEYETFYVPKLINAGAIPKEHLINNQVYIGKHRRCTIARWNQDLNKFEYWRHKFGNVFLDTCNHFEDDDGFALFVPIKLGTDADFKESEN